MDKIVRFSISVAVLMAGAGIFYRYVIFLPRVENQKLELAAHKKLEYDRCNSEAQDNYNANWAAACESNAKSQRSGLANCLSDRLVMTNQFMGASYCKKTFGTSDPSPNCTLPARRAVNFRHYGANSIPA